MRVRLLEAAARLLAQEGPGALSARRAAREVGASTMVVYTHFGGMKELVTAVVREGFARLADLVTAVPRTDDPVADLYAMLGAYRRVALANPHLYAVMFASAPLAGYRITGKALTMGNYTFDQIVEATRRAITAGRFHPGDPILAATQLWSAAHGFAMAEMAGYTSHDQRAARQLLLPLMVNLAVGLGDERAAAAGSAEAVFGLDCHLPAPLAPNPDGLGSDGPNGRPD
jgi:AcrR family transcriptional regulator